MSDYDPSQPTTFLEYLGTNNLYVLVMSVTNRGFACVYHLEVIDMWKYEDEVGNIIECDLDYPADNT